MTYFIQSTSANIFQLTKDNRVASFIKFNNWFNLSANATIDNDKYVIQKINNWSSETEILKNGHSIGNSKSEYFEGYELNLIQKNQKNLCISFKVKGFFTSRIEFAIENKLLLTMHSESDWSTTKYRIKVHQYPEIEYTIEEIILFCGFAAVDYHRNKNMNNEYIS